MSAPGFSTSSIFLLALPVTIDHTTLLDRLYNIYYGFSDLAFGSSNHTSRIEEPVKAGHILSHSLQLKFGSPKNW